MTSDLVTSFKVSERNSKGSVAQFRAFKIKANQLPKGKAAVSGTDAWEPFP